MNQYPNDMADFVRELSAKRIPVRQQVELCKQKFGFDDLTYNAMIAFRLRNKIKNPPLWTEEMKDYLREQIQTHTIAQCAELIAKHFDVAMNHATVKGAMMRYNIHSPNNGYFPKGNVPHNKGKKMPQWVKDKVAASNTWFSKGHRPHNELPIGSQVIQKDGYIFEKVSDELKATAHERWRPLQEVIYERHFGKIPTGNIVIFLDGDIHNFDIDNLMTVSKREHVRMNQFGMRFKNAELTKTGVNLTRLKLAIIDKQKGKKND